MNEYQSKIVNSGLENDPNFNKLLFSTILMHSVISLRGMYGSIGWNESYKFNQSDFECSFNTLVELFKF